MSVDPGQALTVFAAAVGLLAISLWPRSGVVPRLLRLSRLGERVRLEDALKHVYTCQREGQSCSLESLAGRLEISTARAATGVGVGDVLQNPAGDVGIGSLGQAFPEPEDEAPGSRHRARQGRVPGLRIEFAQAREGAEGGQVGREAGGGHDQRELPGTLHVEDAEGGADAWVDPGGATDGGDSQGELQRPDQVVAFDPPGGQGAVGARARGAHRGVRWR